jgi:hypothetical protein
MSQSCRAPTTPNSPEPRSYHSSSEPRPGPAPVRRPGASPSYEATGSSSGTPMIERILTIRRDSTRETCIWLVPIFSAISA